MNSIVRELVEFLGGRCALCDRPWPDKKSWTIHHRFYVEGEKDSKDFKTKVPHVITRGPRKGRRVARTIYDMDGYYRYLKPVVLSRPEGFAPLHNSCHQSITRGARWGKASGNRKRYCDLIMELD